MLSDSQVSILLTQRSLIEKLPKHQARIICLDTDADEIAKTPAQQIEKAVKSNNLAYIIYTSGSTGKPKGVQIQHQGVVNFLTTMNQQPGLTAKDTLNAVTTISFDIAGLELYLPLIVGAKVIVVTGEIATDANRLLNQIQHSVVTVMQATPATWQMLLNAGLSTGKLNTKVLCGGEALTTQLANQLLATVSEVWNVYGPTETTIWSTVSKVEKTNASGGEGLIPIGRPIANTQIYILDTYLQPVPIGIAGELYIGGVGVARGYLNRPELTAERFISHPFNNQPEARLYKTGDLARYLENGDIEYLGRIDNQVKIRGFRIELGEIESVLNQHSNLREAKVICREDIPGDKRLVAYIIPTSNKNSPSAISEQIREYLKQKLPNYMVPSAFVVLETFPLTPNGKIDHRALPAVDFTFAKSNYTAPRTPTEEILSNIWSQVLKVDNIGIEDNFFELGGHSLIATQVISLIRQTFNLELPLRLLFETPTIAKISEQIGNTEQSDNLLVPAIEPRQQQENLPLSFAQQRLWFLDQLEPNSTAYNMPYTLRLLGLINISALEKSISEIIQRHQILHTNFV
ncbi:amino acid adenylation domain-containing protein [Trichormus sp. NMC-1]|uniref:amino acid adenylation domain-containing protein n=1 Tax=Trichormus sp. NMC-1 TaxID=1853259 RepID=UPI001F491A1F|nr:amino acid adenylation domain-containing protein [Trichormus sp. NMC-1]